MNDPKSVVLYSATGIALDDHFVYHLHWMGYSTGTVFCSIVDVALIPQFVDHHHSVYYSAVRLVYYCPFVKISIRVINTVFMWSEEF